MKYTLNSLATSLSLAIVLPIISPTLAAYEAGDWIVRAGAATVQPNDDSGLVAGIDGSSVSVDDAVQLGITASYLITDHVGIELLASTPFEHDISASGSIAAVGEIASATQLPPTLSIQYYPLDKNSLWQPYVGVGVNYTIFFDEETTDNLAAAFNAESSSISLDNSVGLAAEVGVDYAIGDRFLVNATIWWIDLDTNADVTLNNADGSSVDTSVDVSIDPLVYMLSVGYRF